MMPRTLRFGRFLVAWAVLLLSLSGFGRPGTSTQEPTDKSLHLFVVDHSYSMMNMSGRVTRWEFVSRKLEEWLGTLPTDGTADVSVMMFNQSVPGRRPGLGWDEPWRLDVSGWTEADRARATAHLREVGAPQQGEGTSLWNSLGWAMRRIDAEGDRYSESWIYLFTDGEDTNSEVDPRDRKYTYPTSDEGLTPVVESWRALARKRSTAYIIEQPLGDMEPPLDPEAVEPRNVRIYTSRPELKDQLRVSLSTPRVAFPAVDEAQDVEINVRMAGTGKKRVSADAVFRVDFLSGDPGVQLQVEPQVLPLKDGRHVVRVSRKAGDVTKGVAGKLSIGFPEIDKTDILGPREIPIQFAERAKVTIQSLTPAEDSLRWPVGKPLQFAVQHTGTDVSWDFGDGDKATGDSQQHIYNRAGSFDVLVRATADRRDPAERRVRVATIAAGLEIQRLPEQGVIAGKPVRFKATVIAATPSRFEWTVNGSARSAAPDAPAELEVRFEEPGTATVEVRAYTDLCMLERKVSVQVGAGLSLRIRGFQPSIDAGLPAEFSAEVKGDSKLGRIEWEILDATTKALVDSQAKGASPIQAETSKWSLVVPEKIPQNVIVRARAMLEEAERASLGDVLDEVAINVRPVGLNVRKERPADAETLVAGEPNVFEAVWTGTGAASVKSIRWKVEVEGRSATTSEEVQASQSTGSASSSYSVTLPTSADVLGKKITVTATPLVAGAPEDGHAAVWQLSARLPRVDYRIVTNAVEFGVLKYGTTLQATLEPTLYAESVEWDWGDGKSQSAPPGSAVDHSYTLADAGSRRVMARIRRVDGSEVSTQLLFDFRVPSFEIANTGIVRVNRNVALAIGPAELSPYVKEVAWDFGAGYLAPEADLETSHMWTDRVGPVPVRARLTLKDGTQRFVPELSVNVVESATVKGEPTVEGGDTAGAAEMRANIPEEYDYLTVQTEISRDGKIVAIIDGTVASYLVPEGDYGHYVYHFVATRLPSPENPETKVAIGDVPKSYKDRKYALAYGVLLGGGGLLLLLIWAAILYQYPRQWSLKVTTDNPLTSDSLSSLDARTVRFESVGKGGTKSMLWSAFKLRKELRVPTCDLVKCMPEELREQGLQWLADDRNILRINPRLAGLIDSPGEGWDGPETHENSRDTRIFVRRAARSRPQDRSFYAWLVHKPATVGGWIVAAALLIGWLVGWFWFAKDICNIFA